MIFQNEFCTRFKRHHKNVNETNMGSMGGNRQLFNVKFICVLLVFNIRVVKQQNNTPQRIKRLPLYTVRYPQYASFVTGVPW